MLEIRIYTRFNTKSPTYFDICRDFSEKYKKNDSKVMKLCSDKYWGKWEELGLDSKSAISLMMNNEPLWIISAIFSALFFESFIYDYAAHNLKDSFVKNHLDKLDIISKWVVVPKIIHGKEFPKSSKAFEGLKRIIKERNELVHAKSIPIGPFLNVSEALQNRNGKFLKSKEAQEMRQYMLKDVKKQITRICPFDAILEVLSELRKIEGECEISTQWWQLEGKK